MLVDLAGRRHRVGTIAARHSDRVDVVPMVLVTFVKLRQIDFRVLYHPTICTAPRTVHSTRGADTAGTTVTGPQARKLLQRLPLQDMTLASTWPMGSASWPRHMPRNILISRSSRGIRACATTRRAPTRQPPDRPSRGDFFPRVRSQLAGTESITFSAHMHGHRT